MPETTDLAVPTELWETPPLRAQMRADALERALAKRMVGVPSYTVQEAAALLSVSNEHLHKLIRADEFPAIRMGARYVVPAHAVEDLLAPDVAARGQQ